MRTAGIYYLMFTVFPGRSRATPIKTPSDHLVEIFTGIYGFSVGIGGLAYIGLGVGFMSATIFGAYFADRVYASVRGPAHWRPKSPTANPPQLSAKNGGKGKPEYRIPALMFGSLFVPIGILCVSPPSCSTPISR